eukprot:196294_1
MAKRGGRQPPLTKSTSSKLSFGVTQQARQQDATRIPARMRVLGRGAARTTAAPMNVPRPKQIPSVAKSTGVNPDAPVFVAGSTGWGSPSDEASRSPMQGPVNYNNYPMNQGTVPPGVLPPAYQFSNVQPNQQQNFRQQTPQNLQSHTIQQTRPMQPVQNTQMSQPIQQTRPIQSRQPAQMMQYTQQTRPMQPRHDMQMAQPTQQTRPMQPSQDTQMSQPTQQTRPMQPVQSAQMSQATQQTRPTQPARDTQVSQPPVAAKRKSKFGDLPPERADKSRFGKNVTKTPPSNQSPQPSTPPSSQPPYQQNQQYMVSQYPYFGQSVGGQPVGGQPVMYAQMPTMSSPARFIQSASSSPQIQPGMSPQQAIPQQYRPSPQQYTQQQIGVPQQQVGVTQQQFGVSQQAAFSQYRPTIPSQQPQTGVSPQQTGVSQQVGVRQQLPQQRSAVPQQFTQQQRGTMQRTGVPQQQTGVSPQQRGTMQEAGVPQRRDLAQQQVRTPPQQMRAPQQRMSPDTPPYQTGVRKQQADTPPQQTRREPQQTGVSQQQPGARQPYSNENVSVTHYQPKQAGSAGRSPVQSVFREPRQVHVTAHDLERSRSAWKPKSASPIPEQQYPSANAPDQSFQLQRGGQQFGQQMKILPKPENRQAQSELPSQRFTPSSPAQSAQREDSFRLMKRPEGTPSQSQQPVDVSEMKSIHHDASPRRLPSPAPGGPSAQMAPVLADLFERKRHDKEERKRGARGARKDRGQPRDWTEGRFPKSAPRGPRFGKKAPSRQRKGKSSGSSPRSPVSPRRSKQSGGKGGRRPQKADRRNRPVSGQFDEQTAGGHRHQRRTSTASEWRRKSDEKSKRPPESVDSTASKQSSMPPKNAWGDGQKSVGRKFGSPNSTDSKPKSPAKRSSAKDRRKRDKQRGESRKNFKGDNRYSSLEDMDHDRSELPGQGGLNESRLSVDSEAGRLPEQQFYQSKKPHSRRLEKENGRSQSLDVALEAELTGSKRSKQKQLRERSNSANLVSFSTEEEKVDVKDSRLSEPGTPTRKKKSKKRRGGKGKGRAQSVDADLAAGSPSPKKAPSAKTMRSVSEQVSAPARDPSEVKRAREELRERHRQSRLAAQQKREARLATGKAETGETTSVSNSTDQTKPAVIGGIFAAPVNTESLFKSCDSAPKTP